MSEPSPFRITTVVPPELGLRQRDDDGYPYPWRAPRNDDTVQTARAFPEPVPVEPPETQPFACSGGIGSARYQEAAKYRALSEMTWDEARVALNRLVVMLPYAGGPPDAYVAVAEFALAADGRDGFVGRKGEHAVKLRAELNRAIGRLKDRLDLRLGEAENNAKHLARPLPQHGADLGSDILVGDLVKRALSTMVPVAPDRWVRVTQATGGEVLAALESLRLLLDIWTARRAAAESVAQRLAAPVDLGEAHAAKPPTASEYAEALHIAEMLGFASAKLVSLYAGILYAMPIYRLYPAVSEEEAIGLWWPWGRPAPLIDAAPPPAPKARRPVLDPSLITATRPQDVVREVIEKTGINRTTAQRLTAGMRRTMRQQRQNEAQWLLWQGLSKAEVARRVGLSPSRLSALFPGKQALPVEDRLIALSAQYRMLVSE
jgi:hypothetical protein